MSEPKRWMLEWDEDKGCSCGQKEHPQGDFVYYSVYAEVKAGWQAAASRAISYIGQLGDQSAELARLNSLIANSEQENARLKAEVERLENNCKYLDQKLDEELDKSAMLCGQVERLTKAGDAVALDYAERIEIEAGRTPKTLMKIVPVLREWNDAKEGKTK
jgi:hypothetical protein